MSDETRKRGRPPGIPNASHTLVCKRGHPLRGPGADVWINNKGYPTCRACTRERKRKGSGHIPNPNKSRGGLARAAVLTPERRSEIGRLGGVAKKLKTRLRESENHVC